MRIELRQNNPTVGVVLRLHCIIMDTATDKDVDAIELKPAWRKKEKKKPSISESIKSNQVGG